MNQLQTASQTAEVACSVGYTAIMLLESGVEHLAHKRRLAATTHTRDHGHHVKRKAHIQVLEVILRSTLNLDVVVPYTTIGRDIVGKFVRLGSTCIYHFAAMATGFRTNLYGVIGCFLYLVIVLNHHNRIA